jgi:branched-chain amino acid transport system substrate-binding protein
LKKRILFLILAGLLVLALVLTGCGGAPAEQEEEEEEEEPEVLKIGLLVPLTGQFALWGEYFQTAFDIGLEEIGSEMGGRPVEWIVEDEGGFDTALALDKAKKLVESDGVEIMVGPFYGASHFSVLPYTSGVPMVNLIYTQTAREGELDNLYGFWMSSGYYDTGPVTGEYMYDVLGYRTCTTIASDNVIMRDFLAGITDAFEAKGGEVVDQHWPPPDATDLTPYIGDFVISDCLVVAQIEPTSTGLLFAAMDDMGMFEQMDVVIKGGEIPQALMETWPPAIEGIVGSQEFLCDLPYPETATFVDAYVAEAGQLPDEKANNAYCVIKVLAAALEETGGVTDADVLRDALCDLEYDLPNGPFYFDEGRVAVEDRYVCQVQEVDGELKWVILQTFPEDQTVLTTYPH